ncbi:MAG: LbetaH domain-containing protein [Symbiobacteriia bacterium]
MFSNQPATTGQMAPTLQMVPGPYGPRFGVPQGMPMPGSIPVPGSSLPPMPPPPWGDWPMGMAPVPAYRPSTPAYPPGALDFQTTIAFGPTTSVVPASRLPTLAPTVFIAPHSTLVGDVNVGEDVFVGFGAVIRADWGSPFYIGPRCNIQDHAVVRGEPEQSVEVDGRRWSVYLDEGVSCLDSAVLHGPLRIGKNVYIGAGTVLRTAEIGDNCVIMHNATVMGGVRVPAGRLVGAGQVVQSQLEADALPAVPADLQAINPQSVSGCVELARAYRTQLPVAAWPAG